MNLIFALPYIAILLANLLYLYSHNYQSQLHWFQIFLFNFGIMIFAGIFITVHVNILLHKWLVQEQGTKDGADGGNKLTKKQIIQRKVRDVLKIKYFLQDLFIPGNQMFLIKLYLAMAGARWLISLLPGVLVTLLFALYYQYKTPICEYFKKQIQACSEYIKSTIKLVLQNMPRHKSTIPIKPSESLQTLNLSNPKKDN